jgi:hypothetical protein
VIDTSEPGAWADALANSPCLNVTEYDRLDARLARRRTSREIKAAAARRGVSTEWRRRREAAQRVFT